MDDQFRINPFSTYEYSISLLEEIKKSKYIIIYGASVAGREVKNALEDVGIKPEFFWDINPNAKVEGYDVKQPDFDCIPPEQRADYLIIVAISMINIDNDAYDGWGLIRLKLLDMGYQSFMEAISLTKHLKAIHCYNSDYNISMCLNCKWLKDKCFCVQEKYLKIPYSTKKLLRSSSSTIIYKNKRELEDITILFNKFLNMFNMTPSVTINFMDTGDNGTGFINLLKLLISDNTAIINIFFGYNQDISKQLIHELKTLKDRINIFIDLNNNTSIGLLDENDLSYIICKNDNDYKIENLIDYNKQCRDCIYENNAFCINKGSLIGSKCERMFDLAYEYGSDSNFLDLRNIADKTIESDYNEIVQMITNSTSINYYTESCPYKIIAAGKI